MSIDLHQRDLHEFFLFINSKGHKVESVIAWYLGYHGYLNWGNQGLVVEKIKSLIGTAGAELGRSDILGRNAELKASFLEKTAPYALAEYYTAVPAPAATIEILPESENQWRDESLPANINARLRLPRRPAFSLCEVTGVSLFVGPYGYQAFDPAAGTYWNAVSSRAFARSIEKYPTAQMPYPVVIIQDVYDGGNFAHFLFDWLPRIIYFAEMRPDVARAGRFILGGNRGPFQDECLRRVNKHYGIPLENFIFPSERTVLKLEGPLYYFTDQKEPIMHPLNMCHPSTIRRVRALFDDIPQPHNAQTHLYISRRDASMRRIVNEAALSEALSARGYTDVLLSRLSVVEQMSLFVGAKSIVAPHGMGLTHLLFSSPEAQLLELFNPNVGSEDYAFVARALGIRYRFLMGRPVEGNSVDYEVDIEDVIGALNSSF